MSDIPFYRTRIGHDFYERTMPALVRELARLNANVEHLVALIEGVPLGVGDGETATRTGPKRPR